MNVLAVEVHTAPCYDMSKVLGKDGWRGWPWAPIKLRHAQLTVSPAGAVAANVTRPCGVRAWNVGVGDTVSAFDHGDPWETLQPIVIHAARNGVFSGRLVVDSDQPIKGLKATVTELAFVGPSLVEGRPPSSGGPMGAKIPASAVRVRYAVTASPGKSWMSPHRFDGLLDAIPAEIPVVKDPPDRPSVYWMYWCNPITRSNLVAGAVAPLWFTVRVPKDAHPGVYEGRVTISAEGLAPTDVPLRLSVSDWTVPEPKDFRMHNMAYHVDDALARHYNVPLWSDRHFELLGKSHALMAEVGSRQVFVNLTASSSPISPNMEVIRWVNQPGGGAKPDFTVFDKSLDMVATSVGTPLPLRLNVWGPVRNAGSRVSVPSVPLLDPASNKIERLSQPAFGTEEAVAFWRPVFTEILKKIKARGWLDVAALGYVAAYDEPVEEVVDLAKQVWPEAVWACVAHDMARNRRTKDPWLKIRYAYTCCYFGFPSVRGYRELLQPHAELLCNMYRANWNVNSLLSTYRRVGEDIAMSGRGGVSDFGADLVPFRNPQGGYMTSPAYGMPSGPGA